MERDGPPRGPSQERPPPKTSQGTNSSQGSQLSRLSNTTPPPLLSQNSLRQLMEMIPGHTQSNQSAFLPNYWSQLSFYTNSSIPVSQVFRLMQTTGSQPLPNLTGRLSQELTSAASTTTVFNSQESGVKKELSEDQIIDVEAVDEPTPKKVKSEEKPIEGSDVLHTNQRSLQGIEEKPPMDPSASDQTFGYYFPTSKQPVAATSKTSQVEKSMNEVSPFCLRPFSSTPSQTPPPSTPSPPVVLPQTPAPYPAQPSGSSHGIPAAGAGSPFSPLFGLSRYPPPPRTPSKPIVYTPMVGNRPPVPFTRPVPPATQAPIPVTPPPSPIPPQSEVTQSQAKFGDVSGKLRVFMEPQVKYSKNIDYVSGTKTPDVDDIYFVYAREQVGVPFHIVVDSSCAAVAKTIKVKVVYKGTESAVPRCANHQEPHRDSLRPEQRIQFVTAFDRTDIDYISYKGDDGGGFIVNSVPKLILLAFHCRNSCHVKSHKEFILQFTLLDEKSNPIATREVALKIVQVPLRDIRKEGVDYELIPEPKGDVTFRPFVKDDQRLNKAVKRNSSALVKKEEQPDDEEEAKESPELHTIYIHGDDSYARLMRYVKMEEDRKRSTAAWTPLIPKLNSWTNDTPIQELLTHACGPIQADPLLAPFLEANIGNLGEMAERFDSKLLSSLGIKPSFAFTITSLFLNWYNCKSYDDLESNE